MRTLLSVILKILSFIALLIVTIGILISISFIQVSLFTTSDYIMWVTKYPASRLEFIYELYIIFVFFYFFNNDIRKSVSVFLKKYRKLFLPIFGVFNIILLYSILTNVTVVSNNKIVDHSFLSPQGKEYSFKDIIKITAGVYGEKQFFGHSKGDFFYIIELNDGTKIDLAAAESSGAKNDEDTRFILEKLDNQLVNMGIPKKASMENFKYSTKNLAKIHTDKIRIILENTP
ncbi:hypothetical protein BACCIP111895_00196 [Neobacillus rhizosphaerae]|uniref:Uncharacterized protein n=1 Tax=Neobacillus rhizosphaerae TaxID=2880965 RepID=A0ABN8KI16_9BACI|nr:hypothetical protein [Neobacillus rhizosphaerae]CAH2713063.1 hypothetical protein BACCIP111895_00196 [Neobacillus rhizosphaerae]